MGVPPCSAKRYFHQLLLLILTPGNPWAQLLTYHFHVPVEMGEGKPSPHRIKTVGTPFPIVTILH